MPIAILNQMRYKYANRPNPLTPFPKAGRGKNCTSRLSRKAIATYFQNRTLYRLNNSPNFCVMTLPPAALMVFSHLATGSKNTSAPK